MWKGRKNKFRAEKLGRYHFTQMLMVNSPVKSYVAIWSRMGTPPRWYSSPKSTTSFVSWEKTKNKKKIQKTQIVWHSTNTCLEFLKVLKSWKIRKDWETVTDWRTLKGHEDYIQPGSFNWTLARKKDMSRKKMVKFKNSIF